MAKAGARVIAVDIDAISVPVNNAGIICRGTVMDRNAREDWDATLAVSTAPAS
jgi:hypothetical protein